MIPSFLRFIQRQAPYSLSARTFVQREAVQPSFVLQAMLVPALQTFPNIFSTIWSRWTEFSRKNQICYLDSDNQQLVPKLALDNDMMSLPHANTEQEDDFSIWHMAVPKKKVTRHKKRLKTTVQKRIPLKKNIIIDPRTGELTKMHHLPVNWKDYLPDEEEIWEEKVALNEKEATKKQ